MADELPGYYFRIRENGAVVFRVETDSRNRRIDLVEIATVNIRNGNVKPHRDKELGEADLDAIRSWVAERQRLTAERDVDDVFRTIDRLNLTAHWAQARATPEELDRVSEDLLMAMHDLRNVLVRKKAESLSGEAAAE